MMDWEKQITNTWAMLRAREMNKLEHNLNAPRTEMAYYPARVFDGPGFDMGGAYTNTRPQSFEDQLRLDQLKGMK